MEPKQTHTIIELGTIDPHTKLLNAGSSVGQRRVYRNKLSPRKMESLTAICDTFLPSISNPTFTTHHHHHHSVSAFYRTSASMSATPELLGGIISERVEHPKLWLLHVALWLLSTWFGTFMLCGRASLSPRFPYFQRFSQVSPKSREVILLSWSLGYFFLLRLLFKVLKFLTLFVFFTQLDEKDENPTWKAIGYCGTDPAFKALNTMSHSHSQPLQHHQHLEDEGEAFGPLLRGIIYANSPREQLFADSLGRLGFRASVHHPPPRTTRNKNKKVPPFSVVRVQCDAVVVGSGSGGGVAAGLLARAGHKVLVLEKGSYCARNSLSLLEGPAMDQMYLGNGLMATDDMGVTILAGSTVGGGSTINWSASIRTPKHVMKEWSSQYELELFDSELYQEAMDAVCQRMGVQAEISEDGFNNAVLRRGCLELGYPVNNIPRNAPADHYCGWCCLGCKDGRKKGTSETWLVDLVNSGNGAILAGCEASRVLHRKNRSGRNRATGVAFETCQTGKRSVCVVVESKVTVVACGALGTPPLLKRSGLKNPDIGKHLHLHPVTMAWGYFPDNDHEHDQSNATVWPEATKKSYQGGIMTAMSTVVANFDSTGYGAVIQTPSLHPGMFSAVMPWVSGADMKCRMLRFSRTAHVFVLARDRGSGEVASPTSISYKMEQVDEENLQRGVEKMLRILAAGGAQEIGTHHPKGKSLNVKKVSSREFERFVKAESGRALRDLRTPLYSAHQMGSCRMGVDPKSSVVNQMGETWEVEGLYVADSSVFPTALGVNPMVTVQAIAYCTAHSLLQLLRRKKKPPPPPPPAMQPFT
ncbi:Glucose-methanol-choline oxidoreductase, N-terminal [Dillenia turbinata]|uniref:long-chain-alcohol oxidase n=1 Tax=Dillenia turbinata TaxID=194707 RepID=A0AAN8WB75_9MAGN